MFSGVFCRQGTAARASAVIQPPELKAALAALAALGVTDDGRGRVLHRGDPPVSRTQAVIYYTGTRFLFLPL